MNVKPAVTSLEDEATPAIPMGHLPTSGAGPAQGRSWCIQCCRGAVRGSRGQGTSVSGCVGQGPGPGTTGGKGGVGWREPSLHPALPPGTEGCSTGHGMLCFVRISTAPPVSGQQRRDCCSLGACDNTAKQLSGQPVLWARTRTEQGGEARGAPGPLSQHCRWVSWSLCSRDPRGAAWETTEHSAVPGKGEQPAPALLTALLPSPSCSAALGLARGD